MQIFLFDLLPYDRHFDEFKAGRHMTFPLPGSYFEPVNGIHTGGCGA